MFRKQIVLLALAAGLFMVRDTSADAVKAEKKETAAKEAPFAHVVIFQLKKDAGADATASLIADSHEMLEKIPTVRSLKVGRPSEKTEANSVKDYQVGLLVMFDDQEGLKTYAGHEEHLKFVKKHAKNFDKVLVYDFINSAK
jgi:hypothetical protein